MKECACGKPNCPAKLQQDTAARQVKELERALDDAYEARRLANARWIEHLDQLAA